MNKRVLITGGGRGIGAATARYLAAQGYHLCLNYRQDRASAEAVVAEILATHPVECIAVQADVSVEAEVVRLFEEMDARLGPVTHLVNNAGRLQPQMRVLEMSAERINQTLTTNVTSCFLCCREAVRRMTAGGAIVNVSSAAARLGSPGEYVDYAAAKGAVDVLTRGLSLELAAQGIRVNGVRPGFIYTDMHADGGEPGRVDRIKGNIPLQRGGQPRRSGDRHRLAAVGRGLLCHRHLYRCGGRALGHLQQASRQREGAPWRPFCLFSQQLLPDRQHMAPLSRQLIVPHLAGDLREIEAMAEVADLQIGLLEPLRLLQCEHPRHHALIEDAHIV